ncbi:MAG: zinc ribbon domain-containing protein [Zoogloea sp.]|nr:zinc ribbon domain-containing protein [Zoogloea sp.]
MPLYDYRCPACDKTFELLVRSSTVPQCPACGSQQLEKLISKPATPGQSAGIIKSARAQAAREGHFSNYSAAERRKT